MMSENDLISRAALKADVQAISNDSTCPLHFAAEVEQYIEMAPAVDAFPTALYRAEMEKLRLRCAPGAEEAFEMKMYGCLMIVPVNRAPRHGRWVKMTGMMPPEYHGHYECSECGWHMKGLRNSWTREEEMKYCPNCGARMDGDGA